VTAPAGQPGPAGRDPVEDVSVVIPLYNKAPFVRRCLQSIAAQTVPPRAVIVVDDGSSDGGPALVEAFGGLPITLVRQGNAGVSAARNRGLAEAPTELIAFLDPDDEWKPGFIETALALRRRFPDAGIWATSYELVPEDGTARPARLKRVPTDPQGGIVRDFFAVPPGVAAWTGAILGRKSVFEALGAFRVGPVRGEDTELWARVALVFPVAFCPKIMARYYVDPSLHHSSQRYQQAAETPVLGTVRQALQRGEFRHTTRHSLEKYLARQLFALARRCFRCGDRDAGFVLLSETRAIPGCFWRRLRRRLYAHLGRY